MPRSDRCSEGISSGRPSSFTSTSLRGTESNLIYFADYARNVPAKRASEIVRKLLIKQGMRHLAGGGILRADALIEKVLPDFQECKEIACTDRIQRMSNSERHQFRDKSSGIWERSLYFGPMDWSTFCQSVAGSLSSTSSSEAG